MEDIVSAFAQSLRFLVYRDLMNAEVHGTLVRWSPVTVNHAQAVRALVASENQATRGQGAEFPEPPEVEEVLAYNFKVVA